MKSITITLVPQTSIKLPFAHMEMLQGLFYKLLSHNNELSTFVHDMSINNHSVYKLFCFSDIMGKYNVVDAGIEFFGELLWEIRCVDDRIIDTVIETLFRQHQFSLNNCQFTVYDIKLSSLIFEEPQLHFDMKTPAVAYITDEAGKTCYFSPKTDEFYEIVENNLKNKYYLIFGEEYTGEFNLSCKHCPDKYKRVTKYKATIINAWLGKFTLNAAPEMLAVAYYCGIGSKNSAGFGMITMIN